MRDTTRHIWRTEGVRGFYRGFATVVFGTIPARGVYLTTLEATKSSCAKIGRRMELPEVTVASVSNLAAGGLASLITQAVVVPIDVVSQRQMMQGAQQQAGPAGAAAAAAATAPATAATQLPTTPPISTAAARQAMAPTGPSGQQTMHVQEAATAKVPIRRPPPRAEGGSSQASASRSGGSPGSSGSSSSGAGHAPPRPQGAAGSGSSSGAAGSGGGSRMSGLQMVRAILAQEGIRGLYRGFGMSIITYVPSSALWWSSYGTYQKLIWQLLEPSKDQPGQGASSSGVVSGGGSTLVGSAPAGVLPPPPVRSMGQVVGVQMGAALLAGATSGVLTTPLDLVKTRMQLAQRVGGSAEGGAGGSVTIREVVAGIMRQEGLAGFMRGALPRAANSMLWGTTMVSAYEFLKRTCAK